MSQKSSALLLGVAMTSYYVNIIDDWALMPPPPSIVFVVSNSTHIRLEPFQYDYQYSIEIRSFQRCARNKECIFPLSSFTVNHCGSFMGIKSINFMYVAPLVTSTVISTTTSMSVMLSTIITSSIRSTAEDVPSSTSIITGSPGITSSLITSSVTSSSSPLVENTGVLVVGNISSLETVVIVCLSFIAVVVVVTVLVLGVVIIRRCYRLKPVSKPHPYPDTFIRAERKGTNETESESSDPMAPPQLVPNIYTFLPTPPITPLVTSPVPWHRVVVIMSNCLPEADIKTVYAFIKAGLEERSIVVDIYDAGAAGCGPSLWLNRALRNCSKIICVCNRQFKEEWDGQNTEGSPVHALGILVTSHINKGGYPTELFVVTVLREDKQFVPYYLASTVPYRIEQTDDIYRAITGEHKYEM